MEQQQLMVAVETARATFWRTEYRRARSNLRNMSLRILTAFSWNVTDADSEARLASLMADLHQAAVEVTNSTELADYPEHVPDPRFVLGPPPQAATQRAPATAAAQAMNVQAMPIQPAQGPAPMGLQAMQGPAAPPHDMAVPMLSQPWFAADALAAVNSTLFFPPPPPPVQAEPAVGKQSRGAEPRTKQPPPVMKIATKSRAPPCPPPAILMATPRSPVTAPQSSAPKTPEALVVKEEIISEGDDEVKEEDWHDKNSGGAKMLHRGPIKAFRASRSRSARRGTEKKEKKKKSTCNLWNQGKCKEPCKNLRVHECSSCGGSHRATECKDQWRSSSKDSSWTAWNAERWRDSSSAWSSKDWQGDSESRHEDQ
jgi:hypothetical protein